MSEKPSTAPSFEEWQREFASQYMGRLMTDGEYAAWQQMHADRAAWERRGWNAALAARPSMTDDLRAVAPNQISKLVEEIRSGEDSVSIRPIGNLFSFECPYCHREMILHHEGGGKSKHRRVIVYHRDTASADCFGRAETEGERETRVGGWRDY